MFFKRKFFLDLGGEQQGTPQETPVPVAPVREEAPKSAKAAQGEAPKAKAVAAAPAAAGAPAGEAAAPSAGTPTTAEAIAAELAAAQAGRPAPSLATFAPECLSPAGALPRRRRRGGADLADFKAMAAGLLRS